MPSIVFTSRPSASRPSIRHERIERPSTSSAHVPHSPSSQPCFVPVRFKSSRKTSSSVLCGAKATSVCSPLSVKWMCFLLWSGNVFLLHFIQNHIIDKARLAYIRRERNKGRTIIEPLHFLERLRIGDRNVIQTCPRFRFDSRADQIGKPARISLAFLERGLRLLQCFMKDGG